MALERKIPNTIMFFLVGESKYEIGEVILGKCIIIFSRFSFASLIINENLLPSRNPIVVLVLLIFLGENAFTAEMRKREKI